MSGSTRVYANEVPLDAADGQAIVCPECRGALFNLQLGGRRHGQISCAHCDTVLDPGRADTNPQLSAGR